MKTKVTPDVDAEPKVKRTQLTRRKLNDSFFGFADAAGEFSWSKFTSTLGQITALAVFWRSNTELIAAPESLAIILAFIISPELFKKFLTLKYGK